MRSEPQNIGLEIDVLTPKLSCLIRLSHLIFETNLLKQLTQAESVSWWHVQLLVHVTIWKFRRKLEISEITEQFETNIGI